MKRRKKILFLVPSLETGGAERVVVTLLRNLDPAEFELCLVIVSGEGFFRTLIPEYVKILDLKLTRVRYAIPHLIKLFNSERADIIVSTSGHLNLCMLMIKKFIPKGVKLIIRENSIASYNIRHSRKGWLGFLYKEYYQKADLIICQCEAMMDDLIQHFQIDRTLMTKILNPVDFSFIQQMSESEDNPYPVNDNTRNILAVGRLSSEKRYDLLIRTFAKCSKNHLNAKLWIIGEGPLLSYLKELSHKFKVSDLVCFTGFQANPYKWLKHADLYVQTSIYEGLPNALLEALACGCPVLAIACPGGTSEIMSLTGNSQRLIPLEQFEFSEHFFDRHGTSERQEKIFAHFDADLIAQQYSNCFNKM